MSLKKRKKDSKWRHENNFLLRNKQSQSSEKEWSTKVEILIEQDTM